MKYIIELKDDVQVVQKVGVTENGNAFVMNFYKDQLEELNSDYINEHFSDLQDTAYQKGLHDGESKCRYCNEYQRGFEDGKAVHDKGCEACKYDINRELTCPCSECSNNYKNQWTAKDDKIEVGDELTAYSGLKCIATVADYENDIFYVLFRDGSSGKRDVKTLKKTGRHFDIAKILEEMRHD